MDEELLIVVGVLALLGRELEAQEEIVVSITDPLHESRLLDVRLETYVEVPIFTTPFHHVLNQPPRSPRSSPRRLRC